MSSWQWIKIPCNITSPFSHKYFLLLHSHFFYIYHLFIYLRFEIESYFFFSFFFNCQSPPLKTIAHYRYFNLNFNVLEDILTLILNPILLVDILNELPLYFNNFKLSQ